MGFGIQELAVIFIVALLVFGPKRLPELGKALGDGIRDFKKALKGEDEDLKRMNALIKPSPHSIAKENTQSPSDSANDSERTPQA